jgi:hypothetical protein
MTETNLPQEGFLDDDFARFRAERLRRTGKLSLPAEPPPEPCEPPVDDEGLLFFGTSPQERSELRARSEDDRQKEDLSEEESERIARQRRLRRQREALARGTKEARRPRRGVDQPPSEEVRRGRRIPAPPLGERIRRRAQDGRRAS